MGIPVVYQFAELTGEDALLGLVGLEVVARPSVYHVIVVGNTCRMHVGSSYGTIGIGILVSGNL